MFDGIWTLYSEQNESRNGMKRRGIVTIGPNEDPTFRLTRVLARLSVTNARERGPGRWFKLSANGASLHRLVITDCVFATDTMPRKGWRVLKFPAATTFHGRNFVLLLGKPGTYGAEIPKGVTFLEGQPAKDKWHQLRNEWLTAHGYDPRSPEDWNPLEAPVAAPRRESP